MGLYSALPSRYEVGSRESSYVYLVLVRVYTLHLTTPAHRNNLLLARVRAPLECITDLGAGARARPRPPPLAKALDILDKMIGGR